MKHYLLLKIDKETGETIRSIKFQSKAKKYSNGLQVIDDTPQILDYSYTELFLYGYIDSRDSTIRITDKDTEGNLDVQFDLDLSEVSGQNITEHMEGDKIYDKVKQAGLMRGILHNSALIDFPNDSTVRVCRRLENGEGDKSFGLILESFDLDLNLLYSTSVDIDRNFLAKADNSYLSNESTKTSLIFSPNQYTLKSSVHDSQNNIYVFFEHYERKEVLNPGGNNFYIDHGNDIIVLKFDKTGKFLWKQIVEKKQQSNYDNGLFTSFVPVVNGLNVHLVYNIDPKGSKHPSPKAARENEIGVITITSDGDIIKSTPASSLDYKSVLLIPPFSLSDSNGSHLLCFKVDGTDRVWARLKFD